jgi:ribosomal-protein-alanine N-acetyltransferase
MGPKPRWMRSVLYDRPVAEPGLEAAASFPILSSLQPGDIPEVEAIEVASFESGWSPTAFQRELESNRLARYLVVREPARAEIAGVAGLWLVVDEAHVVTVAVRPELRRAGYGRLLVHALIELARAEGMANATLECREANEAARNLYRDYGFYEVGRRVRYYADNNEDAIIMTTEKLESPAYRERLQRLASKLESLWPGVRMVPVEAV